MKLTRRTFLAALLAALAAPRLPRAHEGGIDARGTVAEIGPTAIVVRTADGKSKRFAVGARTEVRRGSAPATLADVRVGERAVVHAREGASGPEAFSIRLARSR